MVSLMRLRRQAPPLRKPWELEPIRSVDRDGAALTVGVLVYRGVTSAEIDEPVTLLADRLAARTVLVAAVAGEFHAVEPPRTVVAGFDPSTAPPIDVLVVPGGLGWKQVIDDPAIREWLRTAAADARAILAISTGSLLLASVGRLEGREATGHWLAEDELAALGATVRSSRTASDDAGRVVTASGALAAIPVINELADHARWAQFRP
ncbi:ThiJ/PfpI family protein [Ilumatobacter coccineus YM16-304]|uniref:ThiJ/PfpI family protein n=2 Tax=Ilumatobacter coccineus TaxID=467094 RepID=A0A6C7E1X8_ILUCY|nr:ThiJ/PfpI family protein [Ilumatobacter coccineus YM16-304]